MEHSSFGSLAAKPAVYAFLLLFLDFKDDLSVALYLGCFLKLILGVEPATLGVVSILLSDGARDDGLGHGSFAILVHSSPFASVSSAGSSCRSSSGLQRAQLSELSSHCHHLRVVIIGGAGKKSRSVGIDRPGCVGLIFLDSLVGILHRQHLIIV